MDDVLFAQKKELIGKMTLDEQRELIKEFQLEIIFNELESRIAERLELARRLEGVMDYMKSMTR